MVKKGPTFINFVKSGEVTRSSKPPGGLLATASDWEMIVDLKKQLKFPEEILTTRLRPDIVLWSRSTKQVALIELTVPWEARMEDAHQRKLAKYEDLLSNCQQNGWRAWNMPVEVGCRGFAAQSLWRALGTVGITGASRRKTVNQINRKAEDASQWLWRKREERWHS